MVDQTQAVKFALNIASGMAFLHTLEPMIARHYLNSKSIMVRKVCSSIKEVYTHKTEVLKYFLETYCFKIMENKSQSTVLFAQIDEDMTARISMADVKFSFQCPGRMYAPAWVAPEGRHRSLSTDLKRQLRPQKTNRGWWMQGALQCLRAKCNLEQISLRDAGKSK